jgi:hypothetical protein
LVKYTIQQGVERAFSERFKGNLQILIPLLLVLAGVTTWALMPHGSHQKPKTLGIYTIKTSDQTGANNSNGKKKNGNNNSSSGSLSVSSQPSSIAPISGRSASISGGTSLGSTVAPVGSAVAPVTGGMGGGLGGGGVTTPPAPTITCVNTGGLTPLTCTACTPPLLVPVGQKVLLYNNGTCTLTN